MAQNGVRNRVRINDVGLILEFRIGFPFVKNLLMPLFLMGCFPGDFQEGKRSMKALGKRPIKEGKRPIKEGKRRTMCGHPTMVDNGPSKKAH